MNLTAVALRKVVSLNFIYLQKISPMNSTYKYYFTFICSVLLFINCSSDDDFNSGSGSSVNYFPLVVDNEWQYDNTQTVDDTSFSELETLSIISEDQNNYNLSSNTSLTASFTRILSSGDVFKNQNQLLLTGNVDIDLGEDVIPEFDIPFENLVVYDANASEGSVLYEANQNFELPEFEGITLNLLINIKSESLGSLTSLNVNNETFDDVLGSKFIVSMEVTATTIVAPLPVPITIDVIEYQEVVTSTNYFAKEVGLVQSETTLNVEYSNQINFYPEFDLENFTIWTVQDIANYQVNME